jgi:hypothetical protein
VHTPTCELPKVTKGRILEDAIDQKSTRKTEFAERESKSHATAGPALKLQILCDLHSI